MTVNLASLIKIDFTKIFPETLFLNKRILVDEAPSKSCDFFLMELVKNYNKSIYQWNDSGEHLIESFSKYNVFGRIVSYYNTEYNEEDISDDIHTMKLLNKSSE